MITLTDIFFWLDGVYFLVAILLAFYLPGVYFISKLKLAKLQEIVLSFIVGMVLWGWQGFVFGYLNIRWFSYVYLILFLILWISKYRLSFRQTHFLKRKISFDWYLVSIILFGAILQLTSVWLTGVKTPEGLYFCCGNVADSILNISVTHQLVNHYPPFEPGFYGRYIANYHYWSSLVMGELIRVFSLPLVSVNYQYMTVFISLFLGLSAVVFGQILGIGKVFSRWLVFFVYFGADLVWFLVAIMGGVVNFLQCSRWKADSNSW